MKGLTEEEALEIRGDINYLKGYLSAAVDPESPFISRAAIMATELQQKIMKFMDGEK